MIYFLLTLIALAVAFLLWFMAALIRESRQLRLRTGNASRPRRGPPGSGGVPYTNNGYPQFFACNDGNSSMSTTLSGAQTACGAQGSTVWFPDLRRDESLVDIDIMVKF